MERGEEKTNLQDVIRVTSLIFFFNVVVFLFLMLSVVLLVAGVIRRDSLCFSFRFFFFSIYLKVSHNSDDSWKIYYQRGVGAPNVP